MTRLKRRILIGTALVVLVLLGVGVWFYFSFFASTSTALRHAEAFLFRRMKVAQLAEQGNYRFFFVTNRRFDSNDGPLGIHAAAGLAKWKRRLSYLPGLGGLAWLSILPEFDPYKYNSFPSNAAEQVHGLTRSVTRRIAARAQSGPNQILPPTQVFKSTVDATVSTDAVVDRLLKHLKPDRHELVLFDINRFAAKSSLLISDPAPLTARLMADKSLPCVVTLVTNENPASRSVLARRKPPFSAEASKTEPLVLAWPQGVISLSHVALPFPPDDPLYGQAPPGKEEILFLGQMAIQGERDLLKIPYSFLVRLRYNPFYTYLETRVLEWFD